MNSSSLNMDSFPWCIQRFSFPINIPFYMWLHRQAGSDDSDGCSASPSLPLSLSLPNNSSKSSHSSSESSRRVRRMSSLPSLRLRDMTSLDFTTWLTLQPDCAHALAVFYALKLRADWGLKKVCKHWSFLLWCFLLISLVGWHTCGTYRHVLTSSAHTFTTIRKLPGCQTQKTRYGGLFKDFLVRVVTQAPFMGRKSANWFCQSTPSLLGNAVGYSSHVFLFSRLPYRITPGFQEIK